MSINAFSLLLTQVVDTEQPSMFVLDENCTSEDLSELNRVLAKQSCAQIISNRYDVYSEASALGLNCQFSDFDFSPVDDNSLSNLYFRVPKERPVAHHIINKAAQKLAIGGSLHLSGAKQEGIKSYVQNAGKVLGSKASVNKQGNNYWASVAKTEKEASPLEDKNYSQLRPIAEIEGQAIYSKPGLFGWNKIDQGSAMLAGHFVQAFNALPARPKVLDLGCGYGYLSIQASAAGASSVCATDNNAAAIISGNKNFQQFAIEGRVEADNCADNIDELFDVVVCHPPFHKGFQVTGGLTEQFIAAAKRHLKASGVALFVANSFVPLEQMGRRYFTEVTVLENDSQFKAVLLAG